MSISLCILHGINWVCGTVDSYLFVGLHVNGDKKIGRMITNLVTLGSCLVAKIHKVTKVSIYILVILLILVKGVN